VFGYWIFVVLMLSTFTSNLAAFLTVERAQSAITSLEALAKQTRVMYGVQKGGKAYSYFSNMKDAEDNLYRWNASFLALLSIADIVVFIRLWVDRVEQASGDAANVFRTWNYPIKEMYKIVWEQMSRNGGFLETPAEGIKRVRFS
jgi:Ligand-gated ion channel